jgi:serine/threonine protein kinase
MFSNLNINNTTIEENLIIKKNIIQSIEDEMSPSQFIVHGLIGKGSFGEVYLVERKNSSMIYAMKVLYKNKIMSIFLFFFYESVFFFYEYFKKY